MAALVVAGAGGIATQAGFNAAVDTNLSASIGEVKVLAGGSSTGVTVAFTDDKFGNTLGPGEHTATVTIKNDGTLPIDIDWAKDGWSNDISGGDEVRIAAANGSAPASATQTLNSSYVPPSTSLDVGEDVTVHFLLDIPQGASDDVTGQTLNLKYKITATQAA